LLRIELEDLQQQLAAIIEAGENAEDIFSMLLESYGDIFEEVVEPTDEQGSVLDCVERKVAVQVWQMFVNVYPSNAEFWDSYVSELYESGHIYITREQWQRLKPHLYVF
jgi:hypothetical protein